MSREAYEQSALESRRKAESAAKITLAQAQENAVMALAGEYGLTSGQAALLAVYEGEETYRFEEGRPTVSIYFNLSQGDGWMERDGIYVVTVNLETGEIEDILYDSALMGNG